MDIGVIYLALGLIFALYIAWNMGANDASNPTDTAVGAGAISIRKAILLFALFAAIGAIVQGHMVMVTIGKGVVPRITALGALIASLAAGLWITLATWKGIPISTTHSITGAVIGLGIASFIREGIMNVNLLVVLKIVLSWIFSPLICISFGFGFYLLLKRFATVLVFRGMNVDEIFKYILIANLMFSAYSFGANDVGNATGVYVTVASRVFKIPDIHTMILLSTLGAFGIAMGGLMWGYRVLKTVAYGITRLDYVSASAAELSNALTVWLFTTIPKVVIGYGMPISTTYASISSIIGAGIAKSGIKGIDWKLVGFIIASWVLTLPVTIGISAGLYVLITSILPPQFIT